MAKDKFIPKASVGNEENNDISRSKFISVLSLGWVAFIAGVGGFFTSLGRMFFPNVSFEPPMEFKIGYTDDFEIGKVDLRFKKQYNVWIVRDKESIYALSTVCTHLGCTPNWLEAEKKFKCPCHGSGFKATGINFEGPAPRPLERYRIVLADSGEIIVDKTQKYQQEKGQWSDSEAFLTV